MMEATLEKRGISATSGSLFFASFAVTRDIRQQLQLHWHPNRREVVLRYVRTTASPWMYVLISD